MTLRHPLSLLVLLFLAVHGLLLVYDLGHPEAMLTGDRSISREEKVRFVVDLESDPEALPEMASNSTYRAMFAGPVEDMATVARIAALGPPGDWAPQALGYALGGHAGLLLLQIILTLVAVVCVYDLGRMLGLEPRLAATVGAVFMLLPASLAQPHQVVTEAVFNPLCVLAVWAVIRCLERGFGWGLFLLGMVCLALGIMVRLQLALLPILLALFAVLGPWRGHPGRAMAALLVPYLPLVAWALFIGQQTGTPGLGPSNFSLGFNFYLQARSLSGIGGFPLEPTVEAAKSLSAGQFIGLALEHPLAFLRFKLAETTNLILNPGINQLVGDYLGREEFGLFTLELRERAGLLGVFQAMLAQPPLWLVSFLGATALWGLLLLAAAAGVLPFWRRSPAGPAARGVLLAYLAYSLAIVGLAIARPGLRSPLDFTIVLLAAFALVAWQARFGGRMALRPRTFPH